MAAYFKLYSPNFRIVVKNTSRKQIVKFARSGNDSFYEEVKHRVNEYFSSNNISTYSNTKMYVKTAVMLSLYIIPYIVIVSGAVASNLFVFYGLWLLMGTGVVGIGTSVMHDCNHGAYTHNKTINKLLGNVLNAIGGYSPNWKIQHNILHHTYTNISGLDEDIDTGIFLRMTPDKPLRSFHKYQHIYAWFLYCLMNLYWVTAKDFIKLKAYDKLGLLVKEKITYRQAVTELIILKVFYACYIFVLPIMFAGLPWYHILLGFVAMHVVAGFSLACIFQPAHVVETSDFARPNDERRMESCWAEHQIKNTADFAPRNKLLSWFIGGLNYQIEHHLFPHICHIHYPTIAAIVADAAKNHNIPYQVMPTFRSALASHARMLRTLGNKKDIDRMELVKVVEVVDMTAV